MLNRIILVLLLFCFNFSFGQIDIRKRIDTTATLSKPDLCRLTPEEGDHIFNYAQVLAEFKGGRIKWFDFFDNTFDKDYVRRQLADSIQYFEDSVVVKFIVTRNGRLCDIQAVSGSEFLRDPVIKVLSSSPNWKPGSSEGRNLNSYRTLKVGIYIDKHTDQIRILRKYSDYVRENDR